MKRAFIQAIKDICFILWLSFTFWSVLMLGIIVLAWYFQ